MNLDLWASKAGRHSTSELPLETEQRAAFSMLEAIDWQCWKYGDVPEEDVTEEDVKSWLIEHPATWESIQEPPSYLGLMSGQFDFLKE